MAKKVRAARHYQRRDAPIRLIADHGVPGIKRDIKAALKHLSTLVPPAAVQYARAGDWHGLKRSIAWGHFREILKAPFARIGKVREAGAQFGAQQINGKFHQARRRVRFRKGERYIDTSPTPEWTATDVREFFCKEFNPDEPRDEHGRWTSGGTSPGEGNVAFHDSLPSGGEIERDGLYEHDDGTTFTYDVSYDAKGGAAVSNVQANLEPEYERNEAGDIAEDERGEPIVAAGSRVAEEGSYPAEKYLTPTELAGVRAGIAEQEKGRLEDRAEMEAEGQRWDALTPEQQQAELDAQNRREQAEFDRMVASVNAAVDTAIARGWRPEFNSFGGWAKPAELADLESPRQFNAVYARMRHHGIDVPVGKVFVVKAIGDDFNVDPYDEALQERIREAQDTLIQILENAAQDAIDQIVASGVEDGLGPEEIVDEIRDMIGLTDVQAKAVANYRGMLEDLDPDALERRLRNVAEDDVIAEAIEAGEDMAAAYIDQMVSDYTDNFLDYRADMIAQTEATRAANAGLQDAYQQSIDRGVFPSDAVRQYWTVALDERTCEICLSIPDMNEEGVAIGEPFDSIDGPMDAPPDPHPNCRCSLEIITDLDKVPDQEQEEAA